MAQCKDFSKYLCQWHKITVNLLLFRSTIFFYFSIYDLSKKEVSGADFISGELL